MSGDGVERGGGGNRADDTVRRYVLLGGRPRGRKGTQDSLALQPVEATPDGRLKIDVRPARRQRLAGVVLAASETTILAAQSDFTDVVLVLSNVDTAARTFTLYHVPSGGAAADANCIGKTVTLAVNGDPKVYEFVGLSKGETLSGLCDSASKVAVTVYGVAL